ncbi:DNA mismatch endonuclease Vsr [uncultured Sneathiella sp.]|jgi:DNA mismatch endonuclease (patch repair protein)|uniref:very short patch repair endonuclease n=1 Tax=uncultured Sneathiella sp. TaxID=879315 RepID=UPI0030D86ADA|tara:strand:- start:30709 stop:31167 length:459 start_codon:yes stop_codon:yes gene_type:complete
MTDIVSPGKRSSMMAGIGAKDTKPEIIIRKLLYRAGFRYRLHVKELPGKPDLVFPKYRAVIFVNGCFWHGHSCHLFKWPKSREEFWSNKIKGNIARDRRKIDDLLDKKLRVMTIWECALKGKSRIDLDELLGRITVWIKGDEVEGEISGEQM